MAGMRYYTDNELELVRKSFSGRYALRDRCYFEMSLQMGLRVSEMLSITGPGIPVQQSGRGSQHRAHTHERWEGRQGQRSHHSALPRDAPTHRGVAAAPGQHA